jgi:hypothetical protein
MIANQILNHEGHEGHEEREGTILFVKAFTFVSSVSFVVKRLF